MASDRLRELQMEMVTFVARRNWQSYHKPKDIAMALSVEAGELLERFLWRSTDGEYLKEEEWRKELEGEMADVLLYLVALANALDMDLSQLAWAKLRQNEERFPVGEMMEP